jgi:hypothetical protein
MLAVQRLQQSALCRSETFQFCFSVNEVRFLIVQVGVGGNLACGGGGAVIDVMLLVSAVCTVWTVSYQHRPQRKFLTSKNTTH